ncbi:hypothetical protein PF005_g28168 [Phytophthora fragariae]|uniref:Uncharacterized protein n=1 Tax=Phytophthora fragariae TaxID=53985 RepID=A0A6A3DPG3_9STRA|nr:hypothetical protein PF009_g28721 [Phytophthora fragariae]KAE9064354.1 hypothetical protein PF006_g30712 [Phytophthora fragariae]KAE9067277.1 hypothetical protein PF007_g28136 [Phytophthora fragariae]KAE9163434.1 hypothetical protein PF004_g30144 [Phytophthora fragariae]KAE9168943.1 hypothetical protein PF005_g28168 [Phytophthora fragariae]
MFLLPNHDYYPLLQSIDADEMMKSLGRVAAFGFIELALMLAMGYLIQVGTWSNRTCFYGFAIQNSLEHNGADFSFKFSWLARE